MEKVYLKFGKHKIDITKDVTGDEVTFSVEGNDIGEAFDNWFCNNVKKKVTKKTVLSLLRDMSIERKNKEEDCYMDHILFLRGVTDEKGNTDLTYNNRCDDSLEEEGE